MRGCELLQASRSGPCSTGKSQSPPAKVLVEVEAIGTEDSAALIGIEVTNTGTIDAEPLEFELDPGTRGRPVRVLRVDAPHYGRAGRVSPAGGAVVVRSRHLVAPLELRPYCLYRS